MAQSFKVISRSLMTSSVVRFRKAGRADYYETLGISRLATQTQIKSAFYELSKKYHPDINPDDDVAHKLYTEITEAYQVLGNYYARKKYDMGTLSPDYGHTGNVHDTGSTQGREKVRQAGTMRKKAGPFRPEGMPTGATKLFNFEIYQDVHYANTIKRERRAKQKKYSRAETTREDQQVIYATKALFFSILALIGVALIAESFKSWEVLDIGSNESALYIKTRKSEEQEAKDQSSNH